MFIFKNIFKTYLVLYKFGISKLFNVDIDLHVNSEIKSLFRNNSYKEIVSELNKNNSFLNYAEYFNVTIISKEMYDSRIARELARDIEKELLTIKRNPTKKYKTLYLTVFGKFLLKKWREIDFNFWSDRKDFKIEKYFAKRKQDKNNKQMNFNKTLSKVDDRLLKDHIEHKKDFKKTV